LLSGSFFYLYTLNYTFNMRHLKPVILLFTLLSCFMAGAAQRDSLRTERVYLGEDAFTVNYFKVIAVNVPVKFTLHINDPLLSQRLNYQIAVVMVNRQPLQIEFVNGYGSFEHTFTKKEELVISAGDFDFRSDINPIPLWMSVLPPLIAILIALIFREVYSALFTGLLVGTTIIFYYQGFSVFISIFKGIFAIADTYILESLSDTGHLSIVVFTMLIGAMVGLITRNGGMRGVVNILSKFARSPRSGQLVTWLLGVVVFFDDYANTLVVGNTMRPVTDRLRISREKLAYIVDSTAAPVAAIAFVTTWIGAELSYIQNGAAEIGVQENPYSIFFNSLAYSFYPIFTLVFILFLIIRKVDFGPMAKAELRARKGVIGELHEKLSNGFGDAGESIDVDENIKPRWFNAVIPVMVIIFGTFAGLLYTGWDNIVWADQAIGFGKKISITIGNADSYKALLWTSISGVVVAVMLTLGQKLMTLRESMESLIQGFKTMLTAVLILILAWSLALITEHMHTAYFISQSMLDLSLSPYYVPAITFLLAALVSFSTGSSWGTMAILYPLLLPAGWMVASEYGLDHEQSMALFYNVVSCVLAGSVLGDHCSPISDTTILSSLASSCNHIEHVRTQLPYAAVVGIVSIFAGTVPAAFAISSWILFPSGMVILFAVTFLFGKRVRLSSS